MGALTQPDRPTMLRERSPVALVFPFLASLIEARARINEKGAGARPSSQPHHIDPMSLVSPLVAKPPVFLAAVVPTRMREKAPRAAANVDQALGLLILREHSRGQA